jgi:hypothetical protein
MISEISTNDIIFIFGEFKNKIYIKNFEKWKKVDYIISFR